MASSSLSRISLRNAVRDTLAGIVERCADRTLQRDFSAKERIRNADPSQIKCARVRRSHRG